MTFSESCLAVIFFFAAMLLVGRRTNVGSRIQAAANTVGWYWPGLMLGGGVVSPSPSLVYDLLYSFLQTGSNVLGFMLLSRFLVPC